MMNFLIGDILSNAAYLRCAHRECTITVLPREIAGIGKNVVHPAGRICLEVAENIRYRLIGPEFYEYVNMIFNAIYRQQNAAEAANDPADVFVKPVLSVGRDHRGSVLCREDNVINEVCIGSGHS